MNIFYHLFSQKKNQNFFYICPKLPKSGTASEVGGDKSDNIVRKKQIERSTVISITLLY